MHTLSLNPQLNAQSVAVAARCSSYGSAEQTTAYRLCRYSTCRFHFPTAGNLSLFVFLVLFAIPQLWLLLLLRYVLNPVLVVVRPFHWGCHPAAINLVQVSAACFVHLSLSYIGNQLPTCVYSQRNWLLNAPELQNRILRLIHLETGSFNTLDASFNSQTHSDTFFGDPLQLIAINQNNIAAPIFSTKF